MKKIFTVLALACLARSASSQPIIHQLRAAEGDTISITWTTVAPPANTPTAILYCFDTLYHWHVYEQTFSKTGDTTWAAHIPLPPATGFVAYKFRSGDSIDNNHEVGYFTMVYYKDGRYMPGAEAGYGLTRSPRYGLGVPEYFKNFSISDTATFMWLSNEILRHQGARIPLVLPYLRALQQAFPQRIPKESRQALHYLLSLENSGEIPLLKAWLICRDILKDTLRADSVHQVLLTRYPAGALARMEAYNKTLKARSMEDRLASAQAFIRDFPCHDSDEPFNRLLGIDYYTVYRSAFAIALAEKKSDIVFEYRNTIPFENIPEVYYKAVEIPYDDWKTMDAKTAFPFSDALYQRMLYYYDHQPAHLWYYSPSEWKTHCDKIFAGYFRLHARILMETGRDKEALALALQAQQSYHYSSADLNQTEAILLQKAGRTEELDTLLYASVRVNQVTAAMISMLRQRFTGPDKDFDAWLGSMKDEKTMQLMKEEIHKSRLSLPAPSFSLLNAEGRQVKLSRLKGKIVVLDFWATWCAPCKAAMAGMNMAVNKYRKDTSVVFYFIDTQERIPDYQQKAKNFLKDKDYDFTILFDTGGQMDTTYSAYAKALHTSGIPFKAVIDAQGTLRYANIGYKGSPSGLSDEISTMIELARDPGTAATAQTAAIDKAPYHSDSVFYDNPKDSIHIGATLTYPADRQCHTAVILLSGTGRQDRDGTMAGHKMFALLADSLTRRGIAVLRSDDRGTGQTNGNYEQSTTSDFADDAIAAVDYLRSRKDMHLADIGLIGHSEGGMAAGIAAAKDDRISFVITLSAPGITGLEALLLQNQRIVHQAPIPDINKMRFDSINHLLFTMAFHNAGSPDLEKKLRNAYAQWKIWDDSVVAANKLAYGGHFFFPIETYIRQATGPWYQEFITYDPAKVLPHVHVPWLAINGDKDLISDGTTNLKGIADNLAKGGNHDVTTWLVPGLNHLYQHCKTCDLSEYAALPETMASEVMTRIADWIEQHG
jgi:peroxiredoxin/alpha/beta superfamily hydrolase